MDEAGDAEHGFEKCLRHVESLPIGVCVCV